MNISNLHFMINWLIDWLIVSVPLKNISFIRKRRNASELVLKMASEQRGIFIVRIYCDTHGASFLWSHPIDLLI